MPKTVDFVLMRGGTSKGVFLRAEDVPQDREDLTRFLLDMFGSPDARQIDGLGGADKLTSKAAMIGSSSHPDADVSYLFAQVGIRAAEVDFNLNCGNLTAAVGLYAIQQGMVAAQEGVTRVGIHNLNTDKIIHADVSVVDGVAQECGDFVIHGVPGAGAPIALDFHQAAGAITGKLLPLGEPVSRLSMDGMPDLDISVVDCANLVVFVEAEALGMSGIETPSEIDGNNALVSRLDTIRREVAHRVGLAAYWESRDTPSTPMCVIVQRPDSYHTYTTGQHIPASDMDLLCRQYSTAATSKALAATVTSCIGVACRIPGTIASRHLRTGHRDSDDIRIGHPTGIISVAANVSSEGNAVEVVTATIRRTARRLAEGRAFLKGTYS